MRTEATNYEFQFSGYSLRFALLVSYSWRSPPESSRDSICRFFGSTLFRVGANGVRCDVCHLIEFEWWVRESDAIDGVLISSEKSEQGVVVVGGVASEQDTVCEDGH